MTPATHPSVLDALPCDVLIVGAGPAGLSLSIALAQAGMTATVLEQQPHAALANPAPDGREIALTHPSRALLQRLGTWARLAPGEMGSLREAQVHDGPLGQHPALQLGPRGTGHDALGFIVPNHALRRTAYAVALRTPGVRIVAGAQVVHVATLSTHAELTYRPAGAPLPPDGAPIRLRAPLLVAADSRHSTVRRQLGIGARMADFGRTVIVCRMRHAQPHGGVAHECFGYERTLAVLPLPDAPENPGAAHPAAAAPHRGRPFRCSVVVTTGAADAAALMALPAQAFANTVQRQFAGRLGAMQLDGERHAYPLVAVYADRFAAPRCALVGDAAVGMHPVTAHGFNLGLAGVERLCTALAAARQQGRDIGDAQVLHGYARAHHRHARPIYEGTNAIVRLYTDTRPLPRLLRQAVLQGARRLPPVQAAIVGELTGQAPIGEKRWLPARVPRCSFASCPLARSSPALPPLALRWRAALPKRQVLKSAGLTGRLAFFAPWAHPAAGPPRPPCHELWGHRHSPANAPQRRCSPMFTGPAPGDAHGGGNGGRSDTTGPFPKLAGLHDWTHASETLWQVSLRPKLSGARCPRSWRPFDWPSTDSPQW